MKDTETNPGIKVETFPRPYVLSARGSFYSLTSEEADRLIAGFPILSATSSLVTLSDCDGHKTFIRAATLGGGPAFKVTR